MFGLFHHPQPPSRREVATQVVKQEQRSFASTELTIDTPPTGAAAPPPDASPIRFSVSYTLAEYMSILRAHLGFMARHMPKAKRLRQTVAPLALGVLAGLAALACEPGWARTASAVIGALALLSLPVTTNLWVAVVAPPVFFLKKRRMPFCEFRIDGDGIERRSRLGTWARTWDEVKMVRRYERGYLLMFASGGIPIPLRCLDQHQQEQLRALTASRTA